jgi:hypothetical protein
MQESEMGENSTKQMSPGELICLCNIFPWILILAGALLTCYGGIILFQANQSKSWLAAQGVITDSSVESHGKSSYGAKVVYDYTVNEKSFSGRRVAFGSYNISRSGAQNIVNRYPKGKTVSVYYDPNNPQACVLEAGVKGQAWVWPGIGLIVVLAGILWAKFFTL